MYVLFIGLTSLGDIHGANVLEYLFPEKRNYSTCPFDNGIVVIGSVTTSLACHELSLVIER